VTKIDRDVLEVGALFEGRLPSAVLADTLNDVHFNEAGLALATLCEHLIEYDVKLSASEYRRLQALSHSMYPDSRVLEPLAKQVVE
jgi:hypothetical protein